VVAAPVAAAPITRAAPPAAPPPSHDDARSESAPSTKPSPLRLGMTVGFGIAAVGAVVAGAVFSAQSTSAGNDAQGLASSLGAGACEGGSPQCAQLKSDSDTANNDRTLSIAFYAGAGVCAAGAVLSWLLLPKTVEARSAVVPMVGPAVAGATWVTTF
jgi:hypothetical protein